MSSKSKEKKSNRFAKILFGGKK